MRYTSIGSVALFAMAFLPSCRGPCHDEWRSDAQLIPERAAATNTSITNSQDAIAPTSSGHGFSVLQFRDDELGLTSRLSSACCPYCMSASRAMPDAGELLAKPFNVRLRL